MARILNCLAIKKGLRRLRRTDLGNEAEHVYQISDTLGVMEFDRLARSMATLRRLPGNRRPEAWSRVYLVSNLGTGTPTRKLMQNLLCSIANLKGNRRWSGGGIDVHQRHVRPAGDIRRRKAEGRRLTLSLQN